jgi:hypothetical protein
VSCNKVAIGSIVFRHETTLACVGDVGRTT